MGSIIPEFTGFSKLLEVLLMEPVTVSEDQATACKKNQSSSRHATSSEMVAAQDLPAAGQELHEILDEQFYDCFDDVVQAAQRKGVIDNRIAGEVGKLVHGAFKDGGGLVFSTMKETPVEVVKTFTKGFFALLVTKAVHRVIGVNIPGLNSMI